MCLFRKKKQQQEIHVNNVEYTPLYVVVETDRLYVTFDLKMSNGSYYCSVCVYDYESLSNRRRYIVYGLTDTGLINRHTYIDKQAVLDMVDSSYGQWLKDLAGK